MSIIQGNAHTSAGGGFNVERSLRFNSADSAYLNRTMGAAATSNTKTTFSCWVKRSTLGSLQYIFASYENSNVAGGIYFTSGDIISIYLDMSAAGSDETTWSTTAVFRDVSAWYHVVVSIDVSQATNANKVLLYVNGVSQTLTASQTGTIVTTQRLLANGASDTIGKYFNSSGYGNFYLTEYNVIDGQALTPSSFGETDSATGVWKPKAYSGTYGTNGFYLPFKTASNWSGYFDGTGDKLTSSTNAIAATGEFSVEAWVYQTARTVTSDQHIFSQYTSGATSGRWYLRFNGTTVAFTTGLGTSVSCATTVNTGTWYHVCVTRDSSNRVRVFLNGVLDGTAVISGSLDTAASVIGATQTANYWQGYISNVRAVSGQIPTAYQTSSTTVGASIFTPSTSQLTAVSGTSLLTCQSSTFVDNSGLGRTITASGDAIPQQFSPFTLDVTDDHSGTGNNWIPNNLDLRTTGVGADILVDSPTAYGTDTGVGGEVRGNYATLNPLSLVSPTTLANGNLDCVTGTTGGGGAYGTIAFPSSGKFYFEYVLTATSGTLSDNGRVGIAASPSVLVLYQSDGNKKVDGSQTAYGASWTTNDVIGVAVNVDSGSVTFYKNNTSQGSISYTIAGKTMFPYTEDGSGTISISSSWNFGQRAFAYTAPSGFKALCTTNLPTPTIGATSTTQANDYFNPVLYTGTGSAQSITGVGFQPDLVWIKGRSFSSLNGVVDAVRGRSKDLYTNLTYAEETSGSTEDLTSFNADGFSLGTVARFPSNNSGESFVAWCWKANGAGSSNTAGSITSTVSANTTSGFSIVQWTGSGANGTVGHGLGVAPQFMFMKNKTNGGTGWPSYHAFMDASAPQNYYISMASTDAKTSASNAWNNTAPTSSVFSVGSSSFSNGGTMIAYVFAPVAGYSAFGSYTGNGSTDGPFVYVGFRPRYLMVKEASGTSAASGNWVIHDAVRDTYNVCGLRLVADNSYAEGTVNAFDFLSNGFKLRTTDVGRNESGGTYIYMAFAETPAKFSLAR